MKDRQATFFVCDDVLVALNGKFTISGMYTGEILIPSEPFTLNQLVIVFLIETPIEDPFRRLLARVTFPGEQPREMDVMSTLAVPPSTVPDRTMFKIKFPFLIIQPILRRGPIEIKVVHEKGEIDAGKQWIVTMAQMQQALSTTPN